jgi:site-specific recombinase XerD
VKARWTGFRSPLADGIQRFLETKRALGRKYFNEERALRLLDRFLVEQGMTRIDQVTAEVLDQFLAARPRTRPGSFNELLGLVGRLLDWLVVQGVLAASPLQARRRRVTAHRLPYLFDPPQARHLLEAAGDLPDRSTAPGRGPTYRTLFALLYGLGLRVGEACHLQCGDVDLERGLLLVRGGKFGKTRLVPFGPRMSGLLREHLKRRFPHSQPDPGAPLFTFDGHTYVSPGTVSQTFLHLTRRLGLAPPLGGSSPRLHDLRHSFAVGTLLRWYRQGIDPAARLQHLSTFLGHVSPVSTAVYLTITDELLREASQRFKKSVEPILREVAP